ncbi:MAG: glycosyltransferase [Thermoplasmata archaeon]|nr:glycosyltransferase [Thermoplasmata archaeon]
MTSGLSAAPPPVTIVVPLPPSYRGGTEEYAYRLAARFARAVPVRIVTTTVRATTGTPSVEIGTIPVTALPGRELFERPVVWGLHARRTLRRLVETSALVQLHMPFPFIERRVTSWARSAGIPVVLTYHMDADAGGGGHPRLAEWVTRAYRSFSAEPALAACGAVVSNSAGYARASPVLSRHLSKVKVIAKGVAPERLGIAPEGSPRPPRLDPGTALLPGSTNQERRIVFVGRLVPYKGLDVLLDAMPAIRSGEPEVVLYVAGKGPMREALERRSSQLGLSSSVRFLGFVPDERLGDLYRSADVVACPSLNLMESTATTLEEAAACGTPVLGSALPGADESIPHDGVHGILVPPGDATKLAEAAGALLGAPRPTDPLRYRTWDDTAAEYLTLFRGLTGAVAPP